MLNFATKIQMEDMRTTTYSENRNGGVIKTDNNVPTVEMVMGYIHSIPITPTIKRIVYRKLQEEIYDEHLCSLKHKLSDIALLERDWDGYEAEPINSVTIKNFKKVLAACKPSDFADWVLSPNTNGTLLLERDEAAVSIASKEYSYYAEQGDRYMEENHRVFSVTALLDTVRSINAFLLK